MREIKFRAYEPKWYNPKTSRNMLYPDDDMYGDHFEPMGLNGTINELQKEGYVLMQYTGLKDKNSKEIYEGDLVDATWGYRGEVEMDTFLMAKLECTISDDIEVIGNIYENPELSNAVDAGKKNE